ncbi:MAG: nitroreductase/quinone reductase family protein [Proteobacteria bacterium]|nr:nitroreductase/quinone reductase family protein [Pseudomonadota bacterium]
MSAGLIGKILGAIAGFFIIFVVLFEAIFLGYMQPELESTGIPMLVITTTDETGNATPRRLARLQIDGRVYVSAHHWTRGWYVEALANPDVMVDIDGNSAQYTAVPVSGEEFQKVKETFPIPFRVWLMMGFPPERDILRLDPLQS